MPAEADLKYCPQCAKKGLDPWKPRSEFYRNKKRSDGLGSECKTCNKEAVAARAEKKRLSRLAEEAKQPPKITKFCPDCGEERPFSAFGTRSDRGDGLKPYCKKHTNLRQKQYYQDNPEFAERSRASSRKWAKDNPEKHSKKNSEWWRKNKDRLKSVNNKRSADWYANNKDRARETQREYRKRRYAEDPNYRLRVLLRNRIYTAISRGKYQKGAKKAGSAVKDLGCSVDHLISFLESKFAPGMTWDNHGTLWEVDHIRCLASFDLTDREQFLAACHFSNLQPLEMEEHLEKTRLEQSPGQEQEQGSRDEEVQLGDHSRAANF